MEKIYNFTETKTQTNQANDFLDLKIVSDGKEPFAKCIKRDQDKVSVDCIVLLEDSKDFQTENGSFNLEILGMKMYEYVVRACPETPVLIHYDHEKQSVANAIKPFLRDSEYTLVLFSDTPLVTKKNVLNILDFVKNKGLNVCPLTRGYVFKTDYIKRVDEIYSPSVYYFDEEDFMMALSYRQVHLITEMLKNRIVDFHSQNGVYFKDPSTLYIEANVSIGKGTKIGSFVSLSGDTVIGENVTIENRSELINAKVANDVKISGAYLDGAFVYSGSKIARGAKLCSQTAIKENSSVCEDTIISNAIIGENSNIGKNNVINFLMSEEQISIGSSCHIMGSAEKPVSMKRGSSVSDMVTIFGGVLLSENQKVEAGEVVKIAKAGDRND